MNLKSVHAKPAPKAESKNISLNHKISDAASNEAKQLAYQYINEWCHNWAIRHSKLQNLDDIQIERVEDFIYWHLTRPRQDSVKNQKTGRVGQSYLDSFMDLITENNTNVDTTWQQKLRAYISKFCNSCSKQVWNEALGASFNAEGSYDEYGSNATEGDMDVESTAAFEDKSGNFGDYETYGESEEENAPGADHSDRDFIEGFKRMSPEMQAALIKELGTGKNFTDPRMKRLYQQMRKYVKKGVDIEDSAPSDNEIEMLVKALNAAGANVTKEQLMKAYASFKKDAKVEDSKITDEDAGPKQGLTPDQWPTEVEDPNTGEMKKVDESMVEGVSDSRIRDSKTTFTLRDLLEGMDLMENGQLNVDKLNSVLDGEIEVKNNSTLLHKFANLFDRKKSNSIKTATKDSKQLKKRDFVTVVGARKVSDGARQFKVYYLDENRKIRILFVKAADEDDALDVAAEKLPQGCEVHSAVDTNPLG